MYLSKTPGLIKPFYKELTWSISTEEKDLYLTFDDGPTSGVTDQVLDLLKHHHALATFFCVGYNVESHRDLFDRIIAEGHAVGNHTYDHTNGWKVDDEAYMETFHRCQKLTGTNLFRPPYGRIKRSQVRLIKPTHHLIMWDVLGGDFDVNTTKEKCLSNVMKNVTSGSIIVLHDSEKSSEKMLYALPTILEELSEQGYRFRSLAEVLD